MKNAEWRAGPEMPGASGKQNHCQVLGPGPGHRGVYILGGREGSTVQYITLQYSLHPGRQGGRRQRRQLRLQAGGRRLAAAGKHGRAQDGLRMRGAPGGGHSFIHIVSDVMLFSELLIM